MYLVLDTETTGHAPDGGDMIQLAVANPDGPDFNEHCCPARPVLPAATAVHGVSAAVAAEFQPVRQLSNSFAIYRKNVRFDTRYIVGHNIKFDVDVVKRALDFDITNTIDTLRMAKKLIPIEEIGGYSLDAVAVYLMPDNLDNLFHLRASHDALNDCKLTGAVFDMLCDLALKQGHISDVDNTQEVADFVLQPSRLDAWPMGKHKGKPLDIDAGYAKWYLRQSNLDPDIVYTLGLLKNEGKL